MYGEMYHRVYHVPDALHHAGPGRERAPNLTYMALCHNALRFSVRTGSPIQRARGGVTFTPLTSRLYSRIRLGSPTVEVGAKLNLDLDWILERSVERADGA